MLAVAQVSLALPHRVALLNFSLDHLDGSVVRPASGVHIIMSSFAYHLPTHSVPSHVTTA